MTVGEEASPDSVLANAATFDAAHDDVFARIAGRYDTLCDVFSLGSHRLWKAAMAAEIHAAPGEIGLDTAAGTGDIALRVVRAQRRGSALRKRIVALDLCPQMLAIARRKAGADDKYLSFALGDVHRLDAIADASVDVYSIAFGMKICDRHRVMAEAFRVLRPGGLFLCLEASHIPAGWLRRLYLACMDWCLPVMARAATGGDRGAHAYLLRGIRDFPDQAGLAEDMRRHGFADVAWRNLSLGIVALHRAVKPPGAT